MYDWIKDFLIGQGMISLSLLSFTICQIITLCIIITVFPVIYGKPAAEVNGPICLNKIIPGLVETIVPTEILMEGIRDLVKELTIEAIGKETVLVVGQGRVSRELVARNKMK
jgi:hypothetical protein